MPKNEKLWSVIVHRDDIPEDGKEFTLSADAETRTGIARAAGLLELPRLDARLTVRRHGSAGLRVEGDVSATVVQTCVVTLEPLTNEVDEAVDLVFEPAMPEPPKPAEDEPTDTADPPEALVDGAIDLGALAVEFLTLGLDPYPRKADAVFEAPAAAADDRSDSPFAALAALAQADGKKNS
jgi:uncharacterized metal-binding protein YceD (DUF177 family)